MVDLQLSGEADTSSLPDILTQSSKGDAGRSNPVVDIGIDAHHSSTCCTPLNHNVWFLVRLSWCRLICGFSLFGTERKAEVVTALR